LVLDRITLHVPDRQFIELAESAGYDAISLWTNVSGPEFSIDAMRVGTPAFKEIKSILRYSAVRVVGAEFIEIGDYAATEDDRVAIESAATIGAKFITATFIQPIEVERAAARIAERADIAAGFGLDISIEFMAEPIAKGMCTLAKASRVVGMSGRPNIGITADMLHLSRCGTTLDDVLAVPQAHFRYIQLCDGPAFMPAEQQTREAGYARQLPGDGEFTIQSFLAQLPTDIPVGLECPDACADPEALARKALARGRALLDERDRAKAVPRATDFGEVQIWADGDGLPTPD
jgi:sugar phosphate isomerase/epimerase